MLRQYISSEASAESPVSSADVPLARAVCSELLVRVSLAPKALEALKDAATVMVAAGADDRALQVSLAID